MGLGFGARKHRCGGTSIWVYRDPDKALPLKVQQKNSHLEAGMRALEQLAVAEIKTTLAHEIRSVFFELNEQNQSLVMQHRMIYSVLQTAPCLYYRFYAQEVKRLVDNQERLNEIALQVRSLVAILAAYDGDPAHIVSEYLAVLRRLGPISGEVQACGTRAAIGAIHTAVSDWIARSDGKVPEPEEEEEQRS